MSARWTAAKCERIHDKLRAAVGGQTEDPEHLLDVLIAAWDEMHREAKDTPLHEMVRLAKEQDVAIDFAVYGRSICAPRDWDDYLGGARITGFDGDPMDVIRAGVRSFRDRAKESASP